MLTNTTNAEITDESGYWVACVIWKGVIKAFPLLRREIYLFSDSLERGILLQILGLDVFILGTLFMSAVDALKM